MRNYNIATYFGHLKNMQIDNWRRLSLAQKEETLQYIVDYKAHQLGLPSICKVVIRNLNDSSKKGIFNKKTDELIINSKLAIDCLSTPYRTIDNHVLANKDVFEVLMHEFEHALQKHAIEIISNHGFDMSVFKLNYHDGNDSKLHSLFCVNKSDIELSTLLYKLQPVERDAFMFAKKECESFNQNMHNLFPNDLAFEYNDDFSMFEDSIDEAINKFQTQTPFEDIDDIIRHINGIEPLKPLNQKMWEAVQKTQTKSLMQQLSERFFEQRYDYDEQKDFNNENDEIERK